ncbi:hypothetical protein MUY27_10320 [Mucilaginibacter sp. RS28]|uniref:Uncharacterized protein n=1 Tax=Mucilaginibacter straminoryzae TaxID=2932774 RepID=A0A9X2B8Z8_9SPHI|nr:DUF6588 family protein [Mucilaginibacter straminoryzae]MCJ8210104.1 hypothetical protein [Mucilaginibacter straminoryzae]
MNKFYYALFAALGFSVLTAKAQSGFDQLIKSSPADATKLIDAYAEPLFKGIGYGLNSGWTNTAKAKGLARFDLRITASMAFAPDKDKSFDVTKIGLSNHLRPASASNTISPTFAGSKNDGPVMNIYDDNGNKVGSYTMPGGQLSFVPTPQLQLTAGIIKNTDLTLRAIPKVKPSEDVGSVSMIGFGFKHNIMRDFVGKRAERLIPFDLAVLFGYTHLNYEKSLNVRPESGAIPSSAGQSSDFSNQFIRGHVNSWMAGAILSKQLAVFTPFVSVAYNSSKTDVGLIGNYPITTSVSVGNFSQKFYTTYKDPVTINKKNVNNVRADIGFQLNLAFFRIFASYGLAEYKTVNGGIGFGI